MIDLNSPDDLEVQDQKYKGKTNAEKLMDALECQQRIIENMIEIVKKLEKI